MACTGSTDRDPLLPDEERVDFFVPLGVAIETEYMSLSDIHTWADKAVSMFLRPKAWVIELACCGSIDKAFDIVCSTECRDVCGAIFDSGRLCLGFHLLKFRENRISVADLESYFVDEVDPCNVDGWDPEGIGEFFRRFYPSDAELIAEIERKFGAYGDEAARAYRYLQSDKCRADHVDCFSHAAAL